MNEISATGTAAPVTSGRHRKSLIFLVLALLVASGFLFLSHNGFSSRCHIDEPGKVQQIAAHERNFNHPLLMLNTAEQAFILSGLKPTPQNIVRVGRTVTGVFAVISVLALAGAAYVTAGPVAAIVCGVFLLGSPLVIELAHYLKEDPAMVMGVAVSLLGAALLRKKAAWGPLVLMAVGAALAASGKHLGVLVIPFCLYAAVRWGGGRRAAVFAGLVLALYSAVNYQMVAHFFRFTGGINREVALIGQGGALPVENFRWYNPFVKYFSVLRGNLPLPLFWFVGFGVWARRAKGAFPLAALMALLFFVAISVVPKTAARYALPVVCLACYLAGVGAAWVFERRGRAWRIAGFALPLLVAVGMMLPRVWDTCLCFRKDTRLEMARWISGNLPADAVIAQDSLGLLDGPASESPYWVPQALYDAGPDIRIVTLGALRAAGVGYIFIVNKRSGGPKKKKGGLPGASEVPDSLGTQLSRLEKIREFHGGKHVANVSPDVVLYRLPPAEAAP